MMNPADQSSQDEWLTREALGAGAAKAMVIGQEKLVLSSAFRDVCFSNACGKYGRSYTCPPDVGAIDALMDKVRRYPRVLVYQTISVIEDSFDYEGMQSAGQAHSAVSRRLHDALRKNLSPGFLHLSAGGCGLCETCGKADNIPCRFPERMLPSLSGYGIDVYNTVKGSDLKYINGPNTVTYFGMVMFDPGEAGHA